jgi:thiamine pyrophosphate-dependent acetolactate synthase large subunit-like protein
VIAGRYGLAVAVIVADTAPQRLEQLARVAGGHGESVTDPSRLALNLRNAAAAAMPAVVGVTVQPALAPLSV